MARDRSARGPAPGGLRGPGARWRRGRWRTAHPRRGGAAVWFLGLALLGAACSGPEPQEIGRHAILVVLDAARADRFGAQGYPQNTTPRMDALAANGVWFELHFAQATSTLASIPTLLYSRYFVKPLFTHSTEIPSASSEWLMRRVDDEAISLPRAFAEAGFRTAAISAHTWIREGTLFAEQFDELHDLSTLLDVPKELGYPQAAQVVDHAIAWISKHQHEDTFLYLHLMDTHSPHRFGEDARRFFQDDASEGRRPTMSSLRRRPPGSGPLSGSDRAYMDALYDGGLRYTDRELGRLIDHLAATGALADTLVAITSDHGEHLLEVEGRFKHGGPWYDVVARIPLLIHFPVALEPARFESFSENVDVAPTMLRLMDVQLPPGKRMDGVDLVPVARSSRPARPFVLGTSGARDAHFKAVFHDVAAVLEPAEAPSPAAIGGELYELAEDPLERLDVWRTRPDVAARMIDAFRDGVGASYERAQAAVDHEAPERPFAIAVTDFQTDREVLSLPRRFSEAQLRAAEPRDGWIRSLDWNDNWLLALPGAERLRVGFPMPNGTYAVTAYVRGEGSIVVTGGAAVPLQGQPVELRRGLLPTAVSANRVIVRGERFAATLRPAAGKHLWISHLGFQPLDEAGAAAATTDPEMLERLRTLGYVE